MESYTCTVIYTCICKLLYVHFSSVEEFQFATFFLIEICTTRTVSTVLQILIHIGALSDKAGFHFAENAGKGGPLGELVQWSDLIASLYALGYNMDFSTEISQLKEFLVVNNRGGCPTPSETRYVAVFLDIVGLKQLKKLTKNRFQMYKYVGV